MERLNSGKIHIYDSGHLGRIDGPSSDPDIGLRSDNFTNGELENTLRHEFGHWDLHRNGDIDHSESDADEYMTSCPAT